MRLKRIVGLGALSLCLGASISPVFAMETGPMQGAEPTETTYLPDETVIPENGLGSIAIQLDDSEDGRSKENVEFGLVKVADLVDGYYVLSEPFQDTEWEFDINKLETADDLETAARAFQKEIEEPEQTLVTDADGFSVVKDLDLGVYLLYAIDVDKYEYVTPFLIALPTWDNLDEVFQYDVVVYPKHDRVPKILVNKVDAQTGKNIISKDFEFTSYEDPECTYEIETVEANTTDGTALFMVDYGTTYIKETAAPEGYGLSDEVVKVEVKDEGLFVNDQQVEPNEEYIYSIRYKDSLLPVVNTSTKTNAMLYGTIAIVALATGGFIVVLRKKFSK